MHATAGRYGISNPHSYRGHHKANLQFLV
jgi:hypothetical protein